MEEKKTFVSGMARLNAVLGRILDAAETLAEFRAAEDSDRKEIECIRCREWPCVCGEPEFESWVSQELRRAEAEGRD